MREIFWLDPQSRREQVEQFLGFPNKEPARVIEAQRKNGGAARRREAEQATALPAEMILPHHQPGVEQGNACAVHGIDCLDAVRLVQIA